MLAAIDRPSESEASQKKSQFFTIYAPVKGLDKFHYETKEEAKCRISPTRTFVTTLELVFDGAALANIARHDSMTTVGIGNHSDADSESGCKSKFFNIYATNDGFDAFHYDSKLEAVYSINPKRVFVAILEIVFEGGRLVDIVRHGSDEI